MCQCCWCPQSQPRAQPALEAKCQAQLWLPCPVWTPAAPTGAFPTLPFPEEEQQVSGTWQSQAWALIYAPWALQGEHALLPTASASPLVFSFMQAVNPALLWDVVKLDPYGNSQKGEG